jgi:hypothetical protein
MTEAWTSTLDTAQAATFGTLGMPIKMQTTLLELTGKRETRFQIALYSIDRTYDTSDIRKRWKNGELEAKTPAHPFLTCMRALFNRQEILDLQKNGSAKTLRQVAGCNIYQYVNGGSGLPGVRHGTEVIETTDLKMVAALATVGFPLLAITGPEGNHKYYLPRYGAANNGGPPCLDGLNLMHAWRRDKEEIPWENPFAQACRVLHNRERFIQAISRDVEMVLLVKPNSNWRSALIRADATPAAFDKVKHHFDR